MKKQNILISLFLIFITSTLFAQNPSWQTSDNLKGLKKIWNVAVIVDDDLVSIIDENKLKVEIELRLRQSKIIIESNNEPQAFSPSTLVVEIRAIPIYNNTYVAEVLIDLHEAISMFRNSKQKANGITWNYHSQLISFTPSKINLLKDEIFFGIDKFINDYLKVNGQ
jgi:hypothetical protein